MITYKEPPDSYAFNEYQQIDLITSRDCTLRCTYCYLQKHEDKDYSIEKIIAGLDNLLTQFDNFREKYGDLPPEEAGRYQGYAKGVVLSFYPEPWVNIPRTNELVQKALEVLYKHPYYAEHFMISMGTNGVRLDKPIPILEHLLFNLSIAVTLDGVKEAHDMYRLFPNGDPSWEIVKNNILKYQQKYNIKTTKITLGPQTLKYMFDDMVFCFEEMHFDTINMNVVFEDIWGSESEKAAAYVELDHQLSKCYQYIVDNRLWETGKYFSPLGIRQLPLAEASVKSYCGAASMRSVDTTGDIYPCFRLSPYALQEDTMFQLDLEAPAGGKTHRALALLNAVDATPLKCRDCYLLSTCPMCVGGAYEEGKSIYHRTTHHCEFQKIQARWAFKLFVAMNREEIIASGNPFGFLTLGA